MTDRYAVIGQPISHSKSPTIHNAFAQATHQDLRYEAVEVPAGTLADALQRLHGDGFLGVNITLPHKADAPMLCEMISERAQLAGAVNTLIRSDAGWRGDNTDGEGLIRDLQRLAYAIKDQHVLVLGSGGAVRGMIAPLLAEQPASLTVSNRSPWTPEKLAEQFRTVGTVTPRTHATLKGDRFDLIINATSAGHAGVMPRIPAGVLAKGGACYDLTYGTAHAPFRKWAEAQGATRIADGLGMLVEQAAAAFALWRGVRPETETVLASLRPSQGA
ncbi:shikimate dehydrogenase [Solimonas terrae]|uniref:Shikimate dehydrogenase (NADP(+)) n=1 Tax=Solimonas terrae TaxID=1396819 RepID=A0A6M2BVH4_9GAMM|nr:shikimate dehydrogenase [Solimonas terrae]NGY06556.1 shikimate dehydrogenase [Solimonas terrae]